MQGPGQTDAQGMRRSQARQPPPGAGVLGDSIPRRPYTAGTSDPEPSSEPRPANAGPVTWGTGKLYGQGGKTKF